MFDRARARDRKQLHVSSLLAAVAGYIDAYSLIWLGLYVSFMSGNTTSFGMNVGKAHLSAAIAPVAAVLSFVLCSFVCNFPLPTRPFPLRPRVLALVRPFPFSSLAIRKAACSKVSLEYIPS